MTIRIFKQFGRGYGPEPVVATVKVGTEVVFSGPVDTLNQETPWKAVGVDIYNFPIPDVAFQGSLPLEISVTGGDLFLAETLANYYKITIIKDNKPQVYSSGPDDFGLFYQETINGIIYTDPFTDEKINGVPLEGPPNPDFSGQWGWIIPNGSTFTATLNIQAGIESPLVPKTP